MRPKRFLPYAAGLAGLLALSACSGQGSAQEGAAAAAAARFLAAQQGDPDTACGLLAPQTRDEVEQDGPCAEHVGQQAQAGPGRARSVEVYGKDAIARFARDTVFLARFDDGWKVTAANCTSRGAQRPFDCSVKVG